jgi:dTDP-4-amino-4,6-dideoxygalactose transaminase
MDKKRLSDLAILGGEPLFASKLFVGCPNIGDRQRLLQRINDALDRRYLTNNGPYVQELEQRVARMTGAAHAVAVANATLGLELVVRALELTGEVVVPSMTFIATAHALQWHGVRPVFCDIDPRTHNLDVDLVERAITPATTGILAVHLWGRPCPVGRLSELARGRGLKLVFDAAHALGCSASGRMIGTFGDAEVFSLHATKMVNALEGGVVATDDDGLARRLRLARNFGFAGYDDVVALGANAKMNEFSAAMGLTSLESFDAFVAVNRRNYHLYREGLRRQPGVSLLEFDERERCTYQYVVLEVDGPAAGVSRDDLLDVCWAENVIARKYFAPGCHQMQPYRALYPEARRSLLQTERLAGRLVILPTGTAVGEREVRGICSLLRLAVAHGEELTAQLRARGAGRGAA